MTPESTFRYGLLALTAIIYAVRVLLARRRASSHTPNSTPVLCTAVMSVWFASIIVYGLGLGSFEFPLHFPEGLRWVGLACMCLALPVSIWVWAYDLVAVFITSRITVSMIANHVDFGPNQLSLNPVFSTFVVCAIGVILLSSNGYVLCTSLAALFAMGIWVKRDYAQPSHA